MNEELVEEAEREQARTLLAELRSGPIPLAGAAEGGAQRRWLLPLVRQRVRAIPAVRRRRRWVRRFSGLALAGAVCGGIGLFRLSLAPSDNPGQAELRIEPQGRALSLVRAGTNRSVESATTIAASGILKAFEPASLTTHNGVRVEMARQTWVGLDGLAPSRAGVALRLFQGRVDCDVPPLGASRRFAVITPSAEVIVHGTRFSVSTRGGSFTKGEAAESNTCVRVTEGRVEVVHAGGQRFLTAGQQWGCEEERSASDAGAVESASPVTVEGERRAGGDTPVVAEDEARPLDVPRSPSDRSEERGRRGGAQALGPQREPSPAVAPPVSGPSQPVVAAKAGTLEQETQLLSRALAAERRGERRAALRLYAELLRRFPRSPLAPEAEKGQRRLR